MQISLEMAVPIIERSILFDEHWYRKMYRLDTQTNAAEHYLMEGYKKGWNPSKYFSTEEYFLENPDVRWGGIYYIMKLLVIVRDVIVNISPREFYKGIENVLVAVIMFQGIFHCLRILSKKVVNMALSRGSLRW